MTKLARMLAIGAALTLASCSILQPQPDLSRFFVLTPMAPAAVDGKALRLGLGPIDFPSYLQRSQMITRIGPNEITLSERFRWGEPLDANFSRVVAQNLAALLPIDQIVYFPWYAGEKLNYQIRVVVAQFEVDTEGQAHLLANWKILDPGSEKTLRTGQADWHEPATDSTPDAGVAALSRLAEKLSRDIADGIEALRP